MMYNFTKVEVRSARDLLKQKVDPYKNVDHGTKSNDPTIRTLYKNIEKILTEAAVEITEYDIDFQFDIKDRKKVLNTTITPVEAQNLKDIIVDLHGSVKKVADRVKAISPVTFGANKPPKVVSQGVPAAPEESSRADPIESGGKTQLAIARFSQIVKGGPRKRKIGDRSPQNSSCEQERAPEPSRTRIEPRAPTLAERVKASKPKAKQGTGAIIVKSEDKVFPTETLNKKTAVRVSLDMGVSKDKLEDYVKNHAILGNYHGKGNVKIEDLQTINRRVRVRVTVTG